MYSPTGPLNDNVPLAGTDFGAETVARGAEQQICIWLPVPWTIVKGRGAEVFRRNKASAPFGVEEWDTAGPVNLSRVVDAICLRKEASGIAAALFR